MLSSNQKMIIVIAVSMLCLFSLKKHFSSKLLKQGHLEDSKQNNLETNNENSLDKNKKIVSFKKKQTTRNFQKDVVNFKNDIKSTKNGTKRILSKKDNTSKKDQKHLEHNKKKKKIENIETSLKIQPTKKDLKNNKFSTKLKKFSISYKVKEDDKSLWDIGRKYYNITDVKILKKIVLGIIAVNEFHKKNIKIFKNDNFNLQVGEIIRLPSKVMVIKSAKDQIASSINSKTYAPAFHIIQEGDNLVKVARKFSKRLIAILNANPDLDPDILSIGTLVYVPE